jgi:predicted  nucleic acid-binding Zn-ribbon protein
MSRTGQLYDLQQVDSGLDSRVARMRQIDEQMADKAQVDAMKAAHAEAEKKLAAEQARLKQSSREVDDTSAYLRKEEKRLYDGSIKNPKELGQVQEEVGHLKTRLKTQEDAVLEAMLAVEEAEAAMAERAQELDLVSKERQQFEAGLMEEKDKLLSQAKVLQVKRQRAVTELPWNDLQTYERLRRSKGGLAVAAVRDGLCSGCHVGVPAHILRHARAGTDLTLCPSCGRILYPIGEVKFEEFNHDLDNITR